MAPETLTSIVPLVDWAATIVLFPRDISSILAVFHLTGLLLDLAAIAPGLYHCYTLLIVRKRRLYSNTGGRAGWRPMPRETLALCLTLFVMCDFCWHAALLVGMGFPNTAHAFHNFRYCLVYAGLVQYLVGVMYSIPTGSRRALIQALGGGGGREASAGYKDISNATQNILDSSSGGAMISPVMSKRSWTRWWALTILSVPVPNPYLLNTFLITSILFPMIITITLSFLVANAWTNETTLALQACLWATWATLAIAFGMAVFVFGNQLVLLVSQTIHSQTQRERSRSMLKKTASSLNQSGNLRAGGGMRPTSASNVTLEVSLRHQRKSSSMPARSASLSVTTDGHVVPSAGAAAAGPARTATGQMGAMAFPVPAPLSHSAPARRPSAISESNEAAEHHDVAPGPLNSPTSSMQSELAAIVPPTESNRVLGVAIDAHLDELADEPGEDIHSKSVMASGGAAGGRARRGKGGQSSSGSSTGSGSDADSPKQSSTTLSDSGFGASVSGAGKPSSLKTSGGTGKVVYSSTGAPGSSTATADAGTSSGSDSHLHRSAQRASPTGSVNQLAAARSGKPRSVVTISTSHVDSPPSGSQQSVNNAGASSAAKPLARSGQSGLFRGVTFAVLLAAQASDPRLDTTVASTSASASAVGGVDLNLSMSSTLSDAQVVLTRRRLAQSRQLNKAKTRMQVSVACILLVSLAFAGISCFQVFGMLDMMSLGEAGVGAGSSGLHAWLFWVPCVTHIMGGGAMAVPVLWSLAWESVKGVGKGAAQGGLVSSPTM